MANNGTYIGSINGIGTFQGINIYDSNVPGSAINPGVINPYSVLTVPAYWRGINFYTHNVRSFTRSVRLEGKRLDVPHWLDRFLKYKPNDYQSADMMFGTLFFHFKHYGGGFLRIKRRGSSNALDSLHNILPDNIVPFRYDDVQYYFNRVPEEVIPAVDMVHLCGLSYDGMLGYNPVWLMRETLQRGMLVDRYQTRFLMKGNSIRGSVEVPESFTDEQLDKFAQTLRTYFSGADADRDLILLPPGGKLSNSGLSPKDSEISWQAQNSTKQIAQILGIDPYFLFENSEAKYNGNAQLAWDGLCRDTFYNDVQLTQNELTLKLLSDAEVAQGLHVHLDMSVKVKGTPQIQATVVSALKAQGIISPNEARAELGYPASDDPSADQLNTAGNTSPAVKDDEQALQEDDKPSEGAGTAPGSPQTHSAEREGALVLSALKPILDAAAKRVDDKTGNAFSRKGEPDSVWTNKFSAEQGRYVAEVLAPVAATLKLAAGIDLPVADLADQYANQIAHRALGDPYKTLSQLIGETLNG